MIKTEFQSPIISLMCILRRNKINKLGKSTKIRLCKACLLFKRQIGVCRGLVIAKPRLPLTRELSSKARLRERKGCGFMRLYFSPSVFLLTQKSTSLVRGRQGRLLQLHLYKPRFVFLQPFFVFRLSLFQRSKVHNRFLTNLSATVSKAFTSSSDSVLILLFNS